MKRLLLIAILLLPLLSLGVWIYWGFKQPRVTSNLAPIVATNTPAQTNPQPRNPR